MNAIPELAGRLDHRFTFIVGKGGVGKTTTAGGLALALADAGTDTHLISTDPAHSLGDLFQQTGLSTPAESRCTPRLVLEELDASAYGADWLSELRPALAQLVERGTYLDDEDVASFLDLAVPGIDEVAAALRLTELAATGPPRILVDTAPTGHALRLLEADDIVAGWLRAFRAMADKAGAVASGLLHRDVRLAAEPMLDELEARMARFGSEVVSGGAGVIVTGAEPLVVAETARLARELERQGLVALARVAVATADRPPEGVLLLPYRSGLAGCDQLRAWRGDDATRRTVPAREAGARGTGAGRADEPTLHALLDREVILFSGKGGVGKSTCAAAAALLLAEDRPVALFSTDPAGSLGDLLGVEVGPAPIEVAGVRVRQLDASAELERLRTRYMDDVQEVFERIGLDRSARLDRAVIESLWELAPPGMDEVLAMTLMAEGDEKADTVVIDTAPTGHFLRLMEMPELALDWIHAVLRILVKYRSALGLDDATEALLRFAKRIRRLRELLLDPERAAVFIVTLEAPMVTAETDRLRGALERAGLPIGGILHNRVRDEAVSGGDAPHILAPDLGEPPAGPGALAAFARRWAVRS